MLEHFLLSVEQLPDWFKLIFAILTIGSACLLEVWRPALNLNYKTWLSHARVNLTLLLFSMLIVIFSGIVLVGVTQWGSETRFGLLRAVELPLWLELLIAVMVLDFMAQYVAHLLLHKVRPLWRVHTIHHSDTRVDATTGTRHHPFDILFRELIALGTILVLGIPLAAYALYRLLTLPFTYLIHANIALPPSVDAVVNKVFVTPNMHKYHHHFELPWTDSNYGGMLSIWDRIFGTYTQDDSSKIRYGLNILENNDTDSVTYLLTVPFDPAMKRDADMKAQPSSG